MTPPQGIAVKMSSNSVERQLGFLPRRAGASDSSMAPENPRLVQQRMESGSSSGAVVRGDTIPFPFDQTAIGKPRPAFGFVMEENKLFPIEKGDERLFPAQEAELRCSLYASQSRMERDGGNVRSHDWSVDGSGDSVSCGDVSEGDEDEDDEEDGVDGDGEVDGLATVDVGNASKNSNTSSCSVQSSSEKIRCDKPNAEKHHSCFGLNRAVIENCGNEIKENSGELHHDCEGGINCENAITVVEPELYSNHILHSEDGESTPHKVLGGDNAYGCSSQREGSWPVYPGESLRAHLSDPVTGILMDDAIILPCGHSFGIGGMQHVQRLKACFKCSLPISEDSVRPNLALRAAVQAFLREEESHSSRISKRRRDRFELDKYICDELSMDPRSRGVQFPFNISDRVIIKGNKRTPERFVGRMAVVTTQCLNGWYVVKTLDNAESVKLQYRSLAKVPDDSSNFTGNRPISSNWL